MDEEKTLKQVKAEILNAISENLGSERTLLLAQAYRELCEAESLERGLELSK